MALTVLDRTGPSGYFTLPSSVIREERTGQASLAMEILSLEGMLPLGKFEVPAGEAEIEPTIFVFDALLAALATPMSVTSYWDPVVIEAPVKTTFVSSTEELEPPHFLVKLWRETRVMERAEEEVAAPVERLAAKTSSPLTPAEELRSISGLPPALLARLFGVSRTTFYNWLEGATPRDARFQHLVDVLAHVKDAERRLPASIDLASWLRTPISPGGQNPLDLLEQKRFATFRGLLVRARSAEMSLSAPSPLPFAGRPLAREERRLARERVSRTPRIEQHDDPPAEGDDER